MAFSTADTIVAIATPPGRGGIGVVRLSGSDSAAIAGRLTTHRGEFLPRVATFSKITARDSSVDQAVVTFFPGPRSYTGEDVVELSAHGSPVVLRLVVEAAVAAGARLAEPGEFTLRAFLNGRIDLTQAEAVADLIDAVTPVQARAAFDQLEGTLTREIAELDAALFDLIARLEASIDFPEEGYHFVAPEAVATAIAALCARTAALLADARRGRLVREGLHVAIVGAPNVGKSSLFNALTGAPRAIVSDVPGTTRDLVTEVVDLDGIRVTLVDTAGLRDSVDAIEAEGVARSRQAQAVADMVMHVVVSDDVASTSLVIERDVDTTKYFIVQNKIDLASEWRSDATVHVSARTGEGLESLRRHIQGALTSSGEAVDIARDRPAITNVRHAALVERAHAALTRAGDAARAVPLVAEEFLLADLQEARASLEEIAGRRAPEDLLEHIFARFCVGK